MTEVKMGDEVIVTDLPAEAVADLQQPAEAPEVKEPEKAPEQPEKPAEAKAEEPAKPAEAPKAEGEQPEPKGKFTKPKPIASLLEKKHELETALSERDQQIADLNQKLQELSKQPNNASTDDDIKALAEETGVDENVLAKIVTVARKGIQPHVPPEVQQLLAERQREKEIAAEEAAFTKRVDGLSTSLKDDLLKKPEVREKLKELAYSTDKAPDGEPYFQKEIAELYFAYVKPEFEPGVATAEPSKGGSQQAKGEVVDFEELLKDDSKMEDFALNAPRDEWAKFVKWRDTKQGDTPIIRRSN